jgi:hypothetical protein
VARQGPDRQRERWMTIYQTAVLGVSAAVIIGTWLLAMSFVQATIGRPGGVALGLEALAQVLGARAPRAPSADTLPGLTGTPPPASSPAGDLAAVPTVIPTAAPTATPTPTPDVRFYDPARARTLLAQAQTSFGSQSAAFLANVTLAASRLDGQTIAPGDVFSFNRTAGPFTTLNGYRPNGRIGAEPAGDIAPIASGITQVSTTLFQAAFWSGLKIIERHPHPFWLDRLNAGSTGQRGLDAYVSDPADDLRIQNTTGDWIRLEAAVQNGTVSVAIYGVDPGWSVSPSVSAPTNLVQPSPTRIIQPDPSLAPGQQFTIFAGSPGFDVTVQREVTRADAVIDRYGMVAHYRPQPAVIAEGPTPTPSPTPTASPTPAPTPTGGGPTHLAGLDPSAFVLPDGRIRTPNLVGLPESEAQQVITAVGLQTTYVNYQGPGDVPPDVLNTVPVGHVLSQMPQPGTPVPRGTTVYLAVRKQ